MAKPRYDLLDRVTYVGLRLSAMLFQWFPINLNLMTFRLLGSFWYWYDRRHRDRALAHLQRSFPNSTLREREQIARRSVQHLLMLAIEVTFSTRLIRIDTWRKYVELADFQKTLELLLDRKRGLIMLTGHYGNWEVLGYTLATLGFETTSVARPLDNPYLNEWVFGVRARQGQKMVDKKGATPEITQLLENGGTVAFVADQNAGSKGIFVDFFGRKASTYKSIGLLAMQYEVPIVIGFARRLNNQFKFLIGTQDIIYPEDWRNENDPLRYITQRYTRAIEDFVRGDPGQYLWVHRRWKTRPKGEAPMEFD